MSSTNFDKVGTFSGENFSEFCGSIGTQIFPANEGKKGGREKGEGRGKGAGEELRKKSHETCFGMRTKGRL